MFEIPAKFLQDSVFSYQQTCKRAKNLLDYLANKVYSIEEKKWYKTNRYQVNCFGHILHIYGDVENIPERLLEKDFITAENYQLLKFYDTSDIIDQIFVELIDRCKNDALPVSKDEFMLICEIARFEEDGSLTKEELLSGRPI